MARYTLEIITKNFTLGPDSKQVSELIEIPIDCRHTVSTEGENSFDITAYSDIDRANCAVDYDVSQEVLTDVDSEDYFKIRHSFSAIPKAGFFGSLFSVTLSKIIPYDGNFKFYGLNLNVLPTNIDPEFFAGMGTTNRI